MLRRVCAAFLPALLVVAGATAGPTETSIQGFGLSIAVSDGVIFVGEPSNRMRPGTVYVYARAAEGWSETARLMAPDGSVGDGFGTAVSAADDRLLVSSAEGGGRVYVFSRDGAGAWTIQAELSGEADEGFGASIAIEGSRAVIGAPGAGAGAGVAYVYSMSGDAWTRETRLEADGLVEGDRFGSTVAIDGHRILVGAPTRESRRGGVFSWIHDGTEWQPSGALAPADVGPGSRFGEALSVAGTEALVGAPMHVGSVGAAMVFSWTDEEGWTQTGQLAPLAPARGLRFGSSVAASDDGYWIGAAGAAGWTGAFHRYARSADGSDWAGVTVQRSASSSRGSGFGNVVAAAGDLVVAGLPGADGNAGAAVVFERAADGKSWTEAARLQGPIEGFDAATGTETRCVDGRAGRFDCEGMDLLSFLPIRDIGGGRATELNDIWGWTDPETGREYALVGRTDGTSFVDITDPVNPVYVGDLPMTKGTRAATWRDMKVYQDHVFVVADGAGQHGVQVLDLARLRDYRGDPIEFDEDVIYDRIASAHNIVINTDTGFAYTVGNSQGGETCGGGLHMIDIRNPMEPAFSGCFGHEGTGRSGTGYNHDAQCVVYHGPDQEHAGREICFGSAETALSIVDVTDREDPRALAAAAYPNVSYSHQGWITEDHMYFYMNDELDEASGKARGTRTLIWDVTDLDDPQLIKEHFSEQKASDHNLYIRGRYMYQSNYMAGLRVLDISDPANPVEVGYFDTTPFSRDEPGFEGSWSNYPYFESGSIIVSSIGEGLFVLRQHQVDL